MTSECHDLDTHGSGESRIAFVGQVPWHRLGQKMEPGTSLEDMLEASHTGFDVLLDKVIAADPETGEPRRHADGTYVYVENSRATTRREYNTETLEPEYFGLATVGTRYLVSQNRHNLNKALTIVQAAGGTAEIETVGALDEGRRFFASIRLGEAEFLPGDVVQRYLNVMASHDGKIPSTFALSGIRIVCRNTFNASFAGAGKDTSFKARHTKNGVDFDVDEAASILGLADRWIKAVQDRAQGMARIKLTDAQVDAAFAEMFPLPETAKNKAKDNNDKIRGLVMSAYRGERGAASFGENGWSLYNAFGEYLDHHRLDSTADERAITSMTEGSWVDKAKEKAENLILAMA